MDETHPANGRQSRRLAALDLYDALTAIKGRAQVTRRRVLRVDRLSREHIAADLGAIDDQASRMAALLRDLPEGAEPTNGSEPTDESPRGLGETTHRVPADR